MPLRPPRILLGLALAVGVGCGSAAPSTADGGACTSLPASFSSCSIAGSYCTGSTACRSCNSSIGLWAIAPAWDCACAATTINGSTSLRWQCPSEPVCTVGRGTFTDDRCTVPSVRDAATEASSAPGMGGSQGGQAGVTGQGGQSGGAGAGGGGAGNGGAAGGHAGHSGGGGNGGVGSGGATGTGGTTGGCGTCPNPTDSCTSCGTCCPRGALCVCPKFDAGSTGGGGTSGATAARAAQSWRISTQPCFRRRRAATSGRAESASSRSATRWLSRLVTSAAT